MEQIRTIKGLGFEKPNTFPNVELISYEPYALRPSDVDIKIIACGVCGADTHFTRGDWGGPHLPIIPGHEIVGIVVNKGAEVTDDCIKLGDRVGVGAGCDSCGTCFRCKNHHENNCRESVLTYGNHVSLPSRQGGYASHIRVNSKFAFKIPDNIRTEHAAPLLCGGITSLSPLLATGVKKDTEVAIVGIGGIGHMGIMFARALGANVTAISGSNSKRELALELGASRFISTIDDPLYFEKNHDAFDVIVHTGAFISNKTIAELTQMLRPNGNLQLITGPDLNDNDLNLNVFSLIANNAKIGGVACGSPDQIRYMLDLVSKNNIVPLVETLDICEDNVKSAWDRLEKSDVKFRFVLTGYDTFFKE